jgi:hypothetical protein
VELAAVEEVAEVLPDKLESQELITLVVEVVVVEVAAADSWEAIQVAREL